MNSTQEQEWVFQTSDNQIIKFKSELINFCDLLQDKDIDEPLPIAIDLPVLNVIKKFCEVHNYEREAIRIKKPIINNKINDNLDQQSVQVLQLSDELFDKVLAASYYLSFDLLRQACLCILACQIQIDDNENDIERARKQYGLAEITPEQENEAITKNRPIFEQLQRQFLEMLNQFEDQQEEILRQQQMQQ
ncbi:unnamed protein product [Paramecium primaurelia]|uniref:SKP1 component POZ domain-containing protein n=1 Tax=Paramecium primaurelia TaxID=5886 RepID=A0A8S1JRP0_PARPR|nr:unnamed protein product [Paramecium primaurelia]